MQKKPDNNPLVCIVILNYKNWQEAVECLNAVFQSTYSNFRIFVIDNDSQNDSLENIAAWVQKSHSQLQPAMLTSQDLRSQWHFESLPQLVLIQNERNAGFAGGNNIVLRLLASEDVFVWLLNPDIVVAESALAELVSYSGTQPLTAIIGSVIRFQSNPDTVHMFGGGRVRRHSATASLITSEKDINDLEYISGGALFTHASQFRKVGLLPEKYFLYWEETDWCYEARKLGLPIVVCLHSVCYDKVGTSVGRGFLAEYYYTRNGLLFLLKYRRKKIPTALFFSFTRLVKKLCLGQWQRANGVRRGVQSFMKMRSDAHQ